MPNVSSFGAQTDNAVVQGTVTDRQMVIPEVPPQGLMSVGPRQTYNFIKEPWNAQTSYVFYDAVKDGKGSTYIATKPVVPVGTPLTDENYWFKSSDANAQYDELNEIVRTFNSRITEATETSKTAEEISKKVETQIANFNFAVTPDMFGGKSTAAMKAANESPADVIVFPSGTYTLTEDIELTKPIYMLGGIIKGPHAITVHDVKGLRVKAFDCQIVSAKNQDGFPEWFNFADDWTVAINKCLNVFNACVLDATEYTIKSPILLNKNRMILRGYNQGELGGNPPSRIICTTGGTLIHVGDESKGAINDYPRNITVCDINLTGTPNESSNSKGVEVGHTVFATIEHMNINDCNYAIELNGAVRPEIKDSLCFNNTTIIKGDCAHIYVNGTTNTTGAAGNNASVYINNINSSFGGPSSGTYYSLKAEGYVTDTYIRNFESNSPSTGIYIHAVNSIRVLDFIMNGIVIDNAQNAGIYVDASNIQNCITGTDIYINSNGTGIDIKELANSTFERVQVVNSKTGLKIAKASSCNFEINSIETELFANIQNAITSRFTLNGNNGTKFPSTYIIDDSINSVYNLGYNGLGTPTTTSLNSTNSTGSTYNLCNLLVNHGAVTINSEEVTTFNGTKNIGNNLVIGPFI